ncbi:MAG: TonB-dependent receptor [Verrucomicrobiota bacterium]
MTKNSKRTIWSACALVTGLASSLVGQEQGDVLELEAFIAEQTANEPVDSLLPTDQVVSGAFMDGMSLFETPRAVSVLSPELLDQFGISDFKDLSKFGASTERVNFYGIAGAPVLRGWQGGIYYNGMLRAFQRNEMPTSFGALDAMEIVKGAAPAHLIPSHVGGYVNMVPKAPYFDEFRGSLEVEAGTYDHLKAQLDIGGPVLIADSIPAAYRVSITAQNSDSYYDDVSNDFVSVYASAKMQLSESTMLTFGGEFFDYKSNENAGWNRPTQNLIDNNQYVIGEPLSLVRSDIEVADRFWIDYTVFPFNVGSDDSPAFLLSEQQRGWFRSLLLPADVVNGAVSAGTITAAQRDAMLDLSDAATRATIYDGLPGDIVQSTSGFLYTPDYFTAGGEVFTTEIDGNEVLADPTDFADSQDFIFFVDLEHSVTPDSGIDFDLLVESLETDKFSSYGYAIKTEQDVIDARVSVDHSFVGDVISVDVLYGGQIRYTEAQQLQDFWTEPFARRDISLSGISDNSQILSGADVDPQTGNNFWGGGFGAGAPAGHAVASELTQLGAFAMANIKFGEKIGLIASARVDDFDMTATVPDGPTDIAQNSLDDSDEGFSWSLNPSITLNEHFGFYGVAQESTTYVPGQGGTVLGTGNFGQGKLQEVGMKFQGLNGRLFSTLAFFTWEQGSFNDRTGISDNYESKGVEFEVTYQATDKLTIIGAATMRETNLTTPLGFRTMPWGLIDPTGAGDDEIGLALGAGSLLNQFSDALGGFTPEGGSPSANPSLESTGSPETTYKLFAVYEDLIWEGFGISGGFVYQDSYWQNYDFTLRLPSSMVWNANVFYKTPSWEVMVGVENLTDEDYFLGSDPIFAANTIITKAPGTEAKVSFKYKF